MKIEFYRHEINEDDIERVSKVLRSPFLTTGAEVAEFEKCFADYLGKRCCVGTTNWTSSAEMTLRAWGIGEGDEVIVPSITYVATAHCVERVGAKPVFAESDDETGLIDSDHIQELITSQTKAIIPVHLYGVLPDMKKLREIADRYGLKILEDAAHAIEAKRGDYRTGTYGDAANFSFYATKNITCGEGGAVVTNDENLADYLRRAVRVGTDKAVSDRHMSDRYQHYDSSFVSGKFNMTNISAAMLLGQLERIEDIYEKRKQRVAWYVDALRGVDGIDMPHIPEDAESAYYVFVVLLRQGVREDVFDALAEHGIPSAINFKPVHLFQYYRNRYGYEEGMLPVAEKWGDRCLTLPFYPSMPREHVEYVCDFFKGRYQQILGN